MHPKKLTYTHTHTKEIYVQYRGMAFINSNYKRLTESLAVPACLVRILQASHVGHKLI